MNLTEDVHPGTPALPSGEPRPPAPPPDDSRVVRALEEYAAALKAGQKPDQREFQARYPEVAEALADCLEGLEFVQAAAPHLQEPAGGYPAAALGSGAEFCPDGPLGDYRIVREVGRGGMGVVYEAVQISLGRQVALKVLPFAAALDAKHLQRFKNEAQAAAHLHHQNIVPVYGVGCDRGVHYYAMQFIDGQTVAAMIAALRPLAGADDEDRAGPTAAAHALAGELASGRWAPPQRGGGHSQPTGSYTPLPLRPEPVEAGCQTDPAATETATAAAAARPTERSTGTPAYFRTVAGLGVQAAEALAHAHGLGVVHRDIKPANLLVDGRGKLWITDFGLAHVQSQAGLTMTGDLVGTLRYMSPEQALAQRVVIGHGTDIYSLGATLYELMTLKPVFGGRDRQELLRQIAFEEPKSPRRLSKAVPAELETIVLKALEKNPADRYATAQELADDLGRFLKDESIRAKRPSLLQRARKWARRHKGVVRTALVALAFLLVTVAVGASLAAWRLNEEQNATRDQLRLTEQAQQLADDRARQIRQDLEGLKAANGLLERGQAYAAWRHWDDADAALTKAIQLRPELSSLWTARADLYTRLGLWELAASDIAKAFELHEPDQSSRWCDHALLRLWVGDRNGYRQACVRMHDRFRGASDARSAMDLVLTCLLVPDPDIDPAALVELARAAAGDLRDMWYLCALGMAHYRAGQYERAVERLRESLKMGCNWPAKGINYPVLAMAYHKLGRKAEARQALDDAARAIDRWTLDRYQDASGNWVEHQGATGFWPIWWWDAVECQLYYREARALMGLPPPPDDPRLHVLRGRAFAGLRWADKAVAEYAAALKLSPHDPQIRLEAHRNRGYCLVGLRQWDRAAAEFARASELQPDDRNLWEFQAVTHLAAGDRDASRRVCAGMLKRFSKTQDPVVAYQVVYTCVLTQDAVSDMDQLLPLARVAARWNPGSIRVLAAAHYRAGHYEKAVECFQKAARVYGFRARDWFFLAMAQHRLGRAEEAQRCLAKAIAWMGEADRQKLDDLSGTRPAWGSWENPIMVSVLRREAEELVEGKKK